MLDPNVIISAALSGGGTPATLLRLWLDGVYELIVSPALLDELDRALAYPKIANRISAEEASELLAILRSQAEVLDDPDSEAFVRSPDPDDDYLICLAQAAPAVIVSGDGDLHGLGSQIPVYTPAAFLALLTRP